MKKTNIRPYTKQFYKGNRLCFAVAMLETVLGTVGDLLVSLFLVFGIVAAGLISYRSKPEFITRGISQYKEYVFEELTKKNRSMKPFAFPDCQPSLRKKVQTISAVRTVASYPVVRNNGFPLHEAY
jgi:hypothetical protein